MPWTSIVTKWWFTENLFLNSNQTLECHTSTNTQITILMWYSSCRNAQRWRFEKSRSRHSGWGLMWCEISGNVSYYPVSQLLISRMVTVGTELHAPCCVPWDHPQVWCLWHFSRIFWKVRFKFYVRMHQNYRANNLNCFPIIQFLRCQMNKHTNYTQIHS
jgi:hypothetical protein